MPTTLTPNHPDTASRHGPARSRLTGPWRRDLSPLTATERRLARYALQLCQGTPALLEDRPGRELIAALWTLLLPLLDPQVLARWLAAERPESDEADTDPWADDPPEDNPRLRRRLIQALRHCPASVLQRLVMADGDQPLLDSEQESGSTYYREPLDLVLGVIWDKDPGRGDFVTFHFDSRRFQPWQE